MNRLAASTPVPLIILLCIAVDQATKWLAKIYLAPDGFISLAGDIFRLQYAENTGAFLSLGSSLPPPWRHIVFTVFVGVFLLALLAYLLFNRTLPAAYRAYLSLVCGGGLSNLTDRIAYGGHVVDFLNLGFGPIRTGIFNVADMAITMGAILLAVDSLKKKPEEPSAA
ncbi:MAG TPA: signal peptidase II [Candidatus Binatia bacterium]|jgi:signal peptidase II